MLGALWLALPLMGSDLAAQVARADFFAAHGPTPVDLRWYAGMQQFGYSLLSQPVMALLGVRVTGALALVASAAALAALLVRSPVHRPLLGSLVGVVTLAGNLVSGRVTYALGVAFGLAALLALTLGRPARAPRLGLAATCALLASATSPVAGLFVGLAGAALLLARRYADGLALGLAAAVPLAATALLFGDGGWMNISRTDTLRAAVTSLVVAALVAYRPVRSGALLSAAGVLAAAAVHTPVGLNATRLVTMFALPVLAAAARPPAWLSARLTRRPANRSARLTRRSADSSAPATEAPRRARMLGGVGLAALLVAVGVWQPPVVPADLRGIGDPTSAPGYLHAAARVPGRAAAHRAGGGATDARLLGGGPPRRGAAGPGLAAAGRHRPQPAVLHHRARGGRHRRTADRDQLPGLAGGERRAVRGAAGRPAVLGGTGRGGAGRGAACRT